MFLKNPVDICITERKTFGIVKISLKLKTLKSFMMNWQHL